MVVVVDGATRDFNLAFFQYCQPTHILLVCAKIRFVRERLLKKRTKAAAVLVVETSILLRTSEAGPPTTKKISATPENIEAHGAHPPNFGDAIT